MNNINVRILIKNIFYILIFSIFLINKSYSANFQIIKLENGRDVISVLGRFEYGDENIFSKIAEKSNDAFIFFHSPGGNASAGIEIGKIIRNKSYSTYVGDDLYCASACALAWLGGTNRFMTQNSRIGFHAVYNNDKNGNKNTSSIGNALVGAYLSQLGLGDKAIIYITEAEPNDMQWLTINDANKIGIQVNNSLSNIAYNTNSKLKKPDWCYRARSQLEIYICTDEEFINLDNILAQQYSKNYHKNTLDANKIVNNNFIELRKCDLKFFCIQSTYKKSISMMDKL
jgi:hypothetical protein